MKVLLKDLPYNVSGIYKINYPDGKIYIGQSIDIKRRMFEHNRPSENSTKADKAINQYGRIEEIEILEYCNLEELNEKEKYWIAYYNSTNEQFGYNVSEGGSTSDMMGDKNPRAVFTNEEALDIRKRRFYGERKRDVYKDYNSHPFASFENVWLGRTYRNVGTEYIIQPHSFSKEELSSRVNSGVNSAKAKLTEEQVIDIRKLAADGVPVWKINMKYSFVSEHTIRRVIKRQTYQNVQ